MSQKLSATTEIQNREWVKFDLIVGENSQIESVTWSSLGCHNLLDAANRAAEFAKSKNIIELNWSGTTHWDLMISEVFSKIRGDFKLPIDSSEELCHCRKILAGKIDEAIVLGAHTPEKVKAWTTASSGCGTCRPEVEKLIAYRLKRV